MDGNPIISRKRITTCNESEMLPTGSKGTVTSFKR
jgi:hypothetical protein